MMDAPLLVATRIGSWCDEKNQSGVWYRNVEDEIGHQPLLPVKTNTSRKQPLPEMATLYA